jgi:hypothetical protein
MVYVSGGRREVSKAEYGEESLDGKRAEGFTKR